MGKNKIKKLENLDKLVNLQCLALQANRIVKIENLEKLVNLTELYLSENGIEKIENLTANVQLETLDLAKNRLTTIDNVSHLTEMDELWVINFNRYNALHINFLFFSLGQVNGNKISDWKSLDNLKSNIKLATVYFEHNPIASDIQYRNKLKLILPGLKQIDATLCR